MQAPIHVTSYNIHKGLSFFNRRMVVHELRDRLAQLGADLVFLQEVQGANARHLGRFDNCPSQPQHEFLASGLLTEFAYGRNAVYDHGHHGNAILSRYPILRWDNVDISAHSFENRGLLHCELEVPGVDQPLHAICLHLALNEAGRRKQLRRISDHIHALVPADAPLILAGDFNDWRQRAPEYLCQTLKLKEVFESTSGRHARSYPAAMPLFALDRIYVRGFGVTSAKVLHGSAWRRLSDHAALTAQLQPLKPQLQVLKPKPQPLASRPQAV
jgi:endonuclease/exonuclease/phosphatase family metal-dependent hydrolase